VKVEQTTGLPVLTVQIDRDKSSRYGLNVGDVQDAVATAIGGERLEPSSRAIVALTFRFVFPTR
jgi:Cu/Ag efflux pump CusA